MQNSKDEIEIKFSKKDIVYLSLIAVLVCIVALVAILVPRYYKLKQTTVPPLNNTPITDQYKKPPFVGENENPSDDNASNNKDNFVNRNENDSSYANNNSDDSTLPDNPTDDSSNIDNDIIKTPVDDEDNSADNPSASNPPVDDENNSADNPSASESSQDDEPESAITDSAYYTTKVMQILKDVGKPYSSSSKYLDADGNLNYSKLNPSDSQLKELESSAKLLYNLFDNYRQQGITITIDFIEDCDELISAIGSFTDIVNDVADN